MSAQESFNEHDWQQGDHSLPDHLVPFHTKNSDVYVCSKCHQIAFAVIGRKPAIEHNTHQRNCGEEIARRIMDQ